MQTQAEFVSFQQRGLLSRTVLQEALIENYRPSGLISQFGLTECAPHPLGPYQKAVLSRLRPVLLRKAIIRVVSDHYARFASPLKALATAAEYERNIRAFYGAAQQQKVWCIHIAIAPVAGRIARKNPLIAESIRRYNTAATAAFQGVDLVDILHPEPLIHLPGDLMADGYHWTPPVHERLADQLLSRVCRRTTSRPLR
jgi:hypothetical protein